VEAAQDEASPTTLPGESPKAKNLLLGEGQSLLRTHFPKAQEPGRRHLRDGREQTVSAGRELTKCAEDETHDGVCIRSVKGAARCASPVLDRGAQAAARGARILPQQEKNRRVTTNEG
jgi:hypothetical protein